MAFALLPTDFWCDLCRKYQPVDPDAGGPYDGVCCAGCGEAFTCGDCGQQIERDGDCEARRTGQHR